MNIKRPTLILALLLPLLLALSFIACDDSDSNEPITAPGSINMLREADAQLKAVDPDAFIVYASGRDSQGALLIDPVDTTQWIYIGITLPAGRAAATETVYELQYQGGQWSSQELSQPPFGIEFIDLSSTSRDVDWAYNKVIDAGLSEPFSPWELFKPLNASVVNSVYVFSGESGKRLVVDTVTGEVTVE